MRLKAEDVPRLIRDAGIVGAGGGGFPTYVKYQHPTKIFIANCTESEPGYYADKLLMRDHPDVIAKCLRVLRDTLGYERVVFAVKKKHIHFCTEVIHYAEESGDYEMAYVPDEYMMGEEKTLTHHITGTKVPRGKIPPDVGVTVQNTESLFNIYWALTEHRPVVHKFLQTIGEIEHDEVIRAPIGTPVSVIWTHHGADPVDVAKAYRLVDGGPLLGDVVEDPARHVVQRTTNGLFVVDPEKFKGRGKYYPGPGHEPPSRISVIMDEVDHVEVPLGGRHGEPAVPVVAVGDIVRVGQVIGEPEPDVLGVPVHASIPGTVTAIEGDRICIDR